MRGFDPVLLLNQAAGSPPAVPWATGYLDGNGVVDAVSDAIMASVDTGVGTWSLLTLGGPPTTSSTAAGLMNGGSAVVRSLWLAPSTVYNQLNVSGFKGAAVVAPAAAAGELHAIMACVDRAAEKIWSRVVTPTNASAEAETATGSGGLAASVVSLGSLGGTGQYTGPVWGLAVVVGHPSLAELQQFAARVPPWDIWGENVVYAWNPGLAYDAGRGSYRIPDAAAQHFGNAAAELTIRNGNLGNIVVP